MPRSGWDEWRIWLKLASKQRRHLDHNERSECLKAHTKMKKAKRMRSIFLKGFDESHLKDHRPTGGNPNSINPPQHQILIHQGQIKRIRIKIKSYNIRTVHNSFKRII